MLSKHHFGTLCVVPALLLFGAISSRADDGPAEADVKVYVGNKDRSGADLRGMTALLIVEPAGGARRTIPLTLMSPAGAAPAPLGHGGEVHEAGDNLLVELVIEKSHGGGDHGAGGGHGHGGGGEAGGHGSGGGHGGGAGHGSGGGHGHGGGGEGEVAAPHFHGKLPVTGYTCGMNGHPVADAPGKCTRCPMQMNPVDRQMTMVVVLRRGGDTINARGFRYPSEAPTSYADGLERIQRHITEIERLMATKALTRVHPVAEKISQVCQQLPPFAPEAKRGDVEAICRATIALFNEIDEAADNNRAPETAAAVEKYKAKLAELRGLAR